MDVSAVAVRPLGRRMTPLTVGHAAVDFTQGALPALLPAIVARFDLTYTAAGALILAATVASSVTQPLFGQLSDRGGALWLLPAGVMLSGVGIALVGIAPTYPLVFACVLASGLGISAYHPEGSRLARMLSGERRAAGMSLFSVGGNLGVAAGPAVAGLAVAGFGLHGASLLVLPALCGALVVGRSLPSLRGQALAVERRAAAPVAADRLRPLAVLLGGVTLRGYVYFGLLAFVPLYEARVRHHGETRGALILSLLLAAGAVGTMVMGRVADRVGHRRAMAGSFAVVGPLVGAYLLDAGPLGVAALVLAGGCLVATFSISTVLAQEYLPSRTATAAGLGFGLSIGVGGMCSVAVGAIADSLGLGAALASCAGAAVLGALLTAVLPADPA